MEKETKTPKCPKCEQSNFIAKNIEKDGGYRSDCVYVVYCTNCGHIVGTAGAGGN